MYTPNFSDPRVQRRIQQAIGFATACFSTTKNRTWSTRYIDKWFGISSNPLSKYLRETVLICTNQYYNPRTHISKSYRLNATGVDQLRAQLNDPDKHTPIYPCVLQVQDLAVDWCKDQFQQELSTRVFRYNNKSNRNWHPLQRVRREIKKIVFADSGLRYQYDIRCCAPRLLLQYSQQIPELLDPIRLCGPQNKKRPVWLQGPMDLWLPAMQAYLADRTAVRNQLAIRAEISPVAAKKIINALFAGARIALNEDSDVYKLLQGDLAKIHYLRQDPYITELRDEIRTMWEYIRPTLQKRTYTTTAGQTRTCAITSRQKWNLYFELEMQVMSATSDYLNESHNKFFTEHDGWVCEREVDQVSLRNFVKEKTGFDVELDLEILDCNNT